MKGKLTIWLESIIPWLITHGIRVALIIVLAYVVKIIANRLIIRTVRIAVKADDFQSEDAEKKREDTLISVFTMTAQSLIALITGMMVLEEVGVEIGPMLAAAGVVGLAFGFGGQYLIRDVITGLFIIMENQYRIGDVVNINGIGGSVENITLRKTQLRDLNGTVHHIPHGEVKTVANLTKDFSRVNINLGISYNSNLENVISVVNKVGNELAEDPKFKTSILKPIQFVRVNDFAESAIEIKMVGDTKPLKQWEVAGEFRKRLKIAFDNEGIVIPFPQRVIHYAKDSESQTKVIEPTLKKATQKD